MIKRAASIIRDDLVFLRQSHGVHPAFMKTNNHMLRGGSLLPDILPTDVGRLLRQVHSEAYEAEGHSGLGGHHPERAHGHAAMGVLHLHR